MRIFDLRVEQRCFTHIARNSDEDLICSTMPISGAGFEFWLSSRFPLFASGPSFNPFSSLRFSSSTPSEEDDLIEVLSDWIDSWGSLKVLMSDMIDASILATVFTAKRNIPPQNASIVTALTGPVSIPAYGIWFLRVCGHGCWLSFQKLRLLSSCGLWEWNWMLSLSYIASVGLIFGFGFLLNSP